jgi:hypothetical protein
MYKAEVVSTHEFTRRHNPEQRRHPYLLENLKSHMKMAVFWDHARSRPDDGGSNVGRNLPDYTAHYPRRQPSSYYHIRVHIKSS